MPKEEEHGQEHNALANVHPHFVFSFRLCYALTFGMYLSSFLKDMVCSPRPYAPPGLTTL
jgi:hypothetical protein